MLRRIFDFFRRKKIFKVPDVDNVLYAFDFDQTILTQDSEAAISSVIRSKIPPKIIQFYNGGNWAAYCQLLIDHVILTDKVPLNEIIKSVTQLELVPYMDALLHKIQGSIHRNPTSHFIVVSGSNDFFVESVLSNLVPPILPQAIISNSAKRVEGPPEPRLIFRAHEDQRTCRKCPRNLCKGSALLSYVDDNGPFATVYYVGDGPNDVCPAMKLRSTDTLFVRKDHGLEHIIAQGFFVDSLVIIRANIVYFETGKDIDAHMKFY